jgi:hypothetical protein
VKEIADNAIFCSQCGCKIVNEGSNCQASQNGTLRFRSILIALFVVVGIIFAILSIASLSRPKQTGFNNRPYINSTATPSWIKKNVQIGGEALAIQPGAYFYFEINVNTAWRNPRLVGRFRAQGGSGDDVYVFVTNEDGLINYKNNHQFKVWYESGKVTSDTINAQLPPGKLYLVISNRFSTFAHKSVMMKFLLEYEELNHS